MTNRVLAGAAALLLCGTAGAAVTLIDSEFKGDAIEGFENVLPVGGHPGPIDVFEGQGTFTDGVANFVQIALSLSSFVSGETIFPHFGNLMAGAVTGWAVFTFDTPVIEFGGYFGTVDELGGGMVTLRDEQGAIIESLPMSITSLGEWEWHGWRSDTPFTSIEIAAHPTPGPPVVYDEIRVSFVPAPGAAGALALGAATLLRRRRTR